MTANELLQLCESRDVTVTAAGDRLEVSGADAALDELCPLLAVRKVELLDALTGRVRYGPSAPPWACRVCGQTADEKGRCWACETRPCVRCSRDTGSVFIAFCFPCQVDAIPG